MDLDFKEPRLPRNLPENVTDMKGYQKVSNYFLALDRIISELTKRFSENDQIHLCTLGALIFDSDPSNEDIEIVTDYYSLDKASITNDIRLYKYFKVR